MNTGATNMNNKHIERSTSTPQADAAPSEAKRGTDAQILFERELTVSAINGAMAFGHQNTNPPPSDDHWLAPFWKIGRKQAELEAAIAAGGAQEPSATLVKCRDMKGAEWFDIKVHDRSLPDGAKLYAAPLANEASKPAAPVGWRFNVGSSDDRIWLTVTTPYGASASLSCAGRHDNGRTIQGQVLMALQEALDAPAAPSVEQDERGAFEAWYRKEIHDATMYRRDVKGSDRYGEYCQWFHEESWKAWQARAASTAANAPSESGADTGNAEADRIIGRLSSSDPDFDDCIDAVAFIRKLVAEHKGPDGFATWKDAAIAERMRRKTDSDGLRGLFLEALDFGIGFGPRLSEVGEWKETRISKANGLVIRAASTSANVAQGCRLVPERITDAMIESAMEAHYGKRRVRAHGGATGIAMTVDEKDYNGYDAMRRFWKGALAAAPAQSANVAQGAEACELCKGVGQIGIPGQRCFACDGSGKSKFAALTAAQSASASEGK
jgi:hypothetical protein